MSNLAAWVAGTILNIVQLFPGEHAGHDPGVVFVVMQVLRMSRIKLEKQRRVFIPILKRWLLGEGKKINFY